MIFTLVILSVGLVVLGYLSVGLWSGAIKTHVGMGYD